MGKLYEAGIHRPVGESAARAEEGVEARNRCAYNQSRGCILGVEVACGDFSFVNLAERMPLLTPKSGAGLWMVPFRGVRAADAKVPIDLIYLDADCRVIEAIEFFPTFRVSSSSPLAASVLALPAHSIFSSHTQPGDQLIFEYAEEIDERLKFLSDSRGSSSAVQEAPEAREEPLVSSAPALPPVEECPKEEAEAVPPAEEAVQAQPWKKETGKPKGWLARLLSPEPKEPRQAAREALPGLAAYFWTGGTPQAHAIRNISSTGLYVVTEERWYPGTLVQLTLKKSANGKAKAECSISVLARANRWGNDGVGLGFVVRDPRSPRGGDAAQAGAVEREELDRFLEQIKKSKG